MEIRQQSAFMSHPLDRRPFLKSDNSGVGKYVWEQLKFSTSAGGIITSTTTPEGKLVKYNKVDTRGGHPVAHSLYQWLFIYHTQSMLSIRNIL